MKTVEDLTELNKIKLNQLFKYINNYIFQAIRSKKHFYCFDNKKNIGCNLYKIGRPLYKAFLKYGISNFKIEVLEECSFEILSKREVY